MSKTNLPVEHVNKYFNQKCGNPIYFGDESKGTVGCIEDKMG